VIYLLHPYGWFFFSDSVAKQKHNVNRKDVNHKCQHNVNHNSNKRKIGSNHYEELT